VQPAAIFLMGPTASGKTAATLALVQHLPVEVISVDSALVFREMNIGTAKPDADLLRQAPHHLINIIDPIESYSAAQFCQEAWALIEKIHARGHIPLLVGGTMLYFNALQYGMHALPQADSALRALLEEEAHKVGWPAMHTKLTELDPVTAARLHVFDAQRIQRALEVCLLTGQPMSQLLQAQVNAFPYPLLKISLMPSDRSVLHTRIAQRLIQMVADGFIEEVAYLQTRYPMLSLDFPSMRCVGYRQAWQHLAGEYNLSLFQEKACAATRQLAKRQLTWLRGMTDCVLIDCLDKTYILQIQQYIRSFLAL
jgi:tRNA dimethylallyltransferase